MGASHPVRIRTHSPWRASQPALLVWLAFVVTLAFVTLAWPSPALIVLLVLALSAYPILLSWPAHAFVDESALVIEWVGRTRRIALDRVTEVDVRRDGLCLALRDGSEARVLMDVSDAGHAFARDHLARAVAVRAHAALPAECSDAAEASAELEAVLEHANALAVAAGRTEIGWDSFLEAVLETPMRETLHRAGLDVTRLRALLGTAHDPSLPAYRTGSPLLPADAPLGTALFVSTALASHLSRRPPVTVGATIATLMTMGGPRSMLRRAGLDRRRFLDMWLHGFDATRSDALANGTATLEGDAPQAKRLSVVLHDDDYTQAAIVVWTLQRRLKLDHDHAATLMRAVDIDGSATLEELPADEARSAALGMMRDARVHGMPLRVSLVRESR